MVQGQEDSVISLLSIHYLYVWVVWVDHKDHHRYLWYLILVSLGQVFEVEDDLVDYYQEIDFREVVCQVVSL